MQRLLITYLLLLLCISSSAIQSAVSRPKINRTTIIEEIKKDAVSVVIAIGTGKATALALLATRRAIVKTDALLSGLPSLLPIQTTAAMAAMFFPIAYFLQSDLSKGPASLMTPQPLSAEPSLLPSSGFSVRRQCLRWWSVAVGVATRLPFGMTGPCMEMGASVGHIISTVNLAIRRLLGASRLNELVLAGAAAGGAANLNLPITGAAMALETFRRLIPPQPMESPGAAVAAAVRLLILCLLSALCASRGMPRQPSAQHPLATAIYSISSQRWEEAPAFAVLGLLTSCTALAFVHTRRLMSAGFRWLPVPFQLRPVAALLAYAACSFDLGLAAGGKRMKQLLVLENQTAQSALEAGKELIQRILGKSLLLSGGVMGGLVAPALFMGSLLGYIYRAALACRTPGMKLSSTSTYMAVSAASMFAVVFRAPVSAIVLILEMTGSAQLLPFLLIAVATSCKSIDFIAKWVDTLLSRKTSNDMTWSISMEAGLQQPKIIPSQPYPPIFP